MLGMTWPASMRSVERSRSVARSLEQQGQTLTHEGGEQGARSCLPMPVRLPPFSPPTMTSRPAR